MASPVPEEGVERLDVAQEGVEIDDEGRRVQLFDRGPDGLEYRAFHLISERVTARNSRIAAVERIAQKRLPYRRSASKSHRGVARSRYRRTVRSKRLI